jgi:hypothetical protein
MKRQSLKISMIATPVMIVCGLLGSGASAMAESDGGQCSNRTLFGDYGAAVEGVLIIPGGIQLPFRAVTMNHFDGQGNSTSLEHVVVNGVPLNPGTYWTPGSGTYTVNPDCTGTMVANTPNSPEPLNLAFVVVRHGTEIHAVLDAHALSTVFIKVD